MVYKSLNRQLKVMTLVYVDVEICARGNVPIYCIKHLKCYSFGSYSSRYWGSKKEIKPYEAHLNFV